MQTGPSRGYLVDDLTVEGEGVRPTLDTHGLTTSAATFRVPTDDPQPLAVATPRGMLGLPLRQCSQQDAGLLRTVKGEGVGY